MIEYLDLYNVFVNEIAGHPLIFLFLALIVIFFFAAKFRFPNYITLMIFTVFVLLISSYIPFLFPITLLFIGFIFATQLYKFFSR